MSRYTGSIYRKARRLNFQFLNLVKNLRIINQKGVKVPGQHGSLIRPKLSNYGEQLQEKQKMQFMYGLNDRQFRRLFAVSKRWVGS